MALDLTLAQITALLEGQGDLDRSFMSQVRLAVWGTAEDMARAMAPRPSDDDADLGESLAAWGLREV